MKVVDITGMKFGRLSVIGKSEAVRAAGAYWVCRCECGSTRDVASLKLRRGLIVSCGCYRAANKPNLQHGQAKVGSRTYRTWKEMRQRCLNPKSDKWKWYGGRGISICQEWQESFEAFYRDMGDRPPGMTLDRIDPDGDYKKSNCRWATAAQQAETNRGVFKRGLVPWNKKSGVASESSGRQTLLL